MLNLDVWKLGLCFGYFGGGLQACGKWNYTMMKSDTKTDVFMA